MQWSDFGIADYAERLVFEEGKFYLTIEANKTITKTLTPKKAEEWYKKRFPSCSWKKIEKQVEAFKKAA